LRGLLRAGAATTVAISLLTGTAASTSDFDVADNIRAERRLGEETKKVRKHHKQRSAVLRKPVREAQDEATRTPTRRGSLSYAADNIRSDVAKHIRADRRRTEEMNEPRKRHKPRSAAHRKAVREAKDEANREPSRGSLPEVAYNIRVERWLGKEMSRIRKHHRERSASLRKTVREAAHDASQEPNRGTLRKLHLANRDAWMFDHLVTRRLANMERRLDEVRSWLDTWGVFRVCPVDPPHYIHNDFGETVNVPDVEPHRHLGSDIEAPTWTPIRAPFDGYAWSSYTPLGGYQVRVRGDRGYVFNAHLIAYGDLGWVGAGTVIGYVGATGDSTAPHDHFEWHPWGGGAVDPYYLLTLACG